MTGQTGDARWGDLLVTGEARRREIRQRHGNGLDTVEVDHGGRRLVLTFLEHAPTTVRPDNVRIEGPHGAATLEITRVRRAAEDDPHLEDRLLVELAGPGGPGRYTVRLVERSAHGRAGWAPLAGLDPRFAQGSFTFTVDRPNPVTGPSPTSLPASPDNQASYLARDYEGLRQLMVDRLAKTMPAWTETHVPDIGVTLIELLASIGDDLSYYQDAVATEAYLQTARRRISVRRHGRLVDYRLGEGGQARAWVCVSVTAAVELPLRDVIFVAAPGGTEAVAPVLAGERLHSFAPGSARPYTPVRAGLGPPAPIGSDDRGPGPTVALTPAHNDISLWTWGEPDARLRAGATSAVLIDRWSDTTDHRRSGPRWLSLQPGDVVILEATRDPSGVGPPDPTQRHPVRLTAVHPSVDRLYGQPIVEITWAPAEALPFALQVSVPGPDGAALPCAVVRANTVLVGDGAGVAEDLATGQRVLARPSLTWAVAYPDPGTVARHQATGLRRLPAAWRAEVEQWRRAAGDGQPLKSHELNLLRRLLGAAVLTELGLGGDGDEYRGDGQDADRGDGQDADRGDGQDADRGDGQDADRGGGQDADRGGGHGARRDGGGMRDDARHGEREPEHAERDAERAAQDADGLRRLLLEADRLAAPRVRRAHVLAALARAGGPISEVLLREVADDWGAELAGALSAHHPAAWGTAAAATGTDGCASLPLLTLAPVVGAGDDSTTDDGPWTVAPDVVGSAPGSRQVMVEVDDAGAAHLRFSPGDDPTGPVRAVYQVGLGEAGNVPAEAINTIVAATPEAAAVVVAVNGVRNPLAAVGGTEPETIVAAKVAIPGAFRVDQPRALVAADYSAAAERVAGVRRAATVLRWTGWGHAADVAIQPAIGEDPDQELLAAVDDELGALRRIGHELWVRPPTYRPVVIELDVDIDADTVRADVITELAALLSSGGQRDGTPGLFSPVRMEFGRPIYASGIVAAVQGVAGVEAVVMTRFCFLQPGGVARTRRHPELLRLRPSEIARLDNDPDAPERGYATVNLRGGR